MGSFVITFCAAVTASYMKMEYTGKLLALTYLIGNKSYSKVLDAAQPKFWMNVPDSKAIVIKELLATLRRLVQIVNAKYKVHKLSL